MPKITKDKDTSVGRQQSDYLYRNRYVNLSGNKVALDVYFRNCIIVYQTFTTNIIDLNDTWYHIYMRHHTHICVSACV